MFRKLFLVGSALVAFVAHASAQSIVIDGVVDRTTYNDTATFRVQTNAGFSYAVTLNGIAMPAGVTNIVTRMDYYDLAVTRTDNNTLAVSNALIRFIVLSSQRGSPELGLIQWVPLPPIPSTVAEMAGAHLDLLAPQTYPAGLDIPVVVRVEDGSGKARRVNGWMSAPGFETSAFRIVRGVGFGLLPPASAGTNLSFNGSLQSLSTNRAITIESNTTWTTVSGVLANTTWPTNSRIHVTGNLTVPAGVTLTIEEGTVVRLNPGINITNTGRTVINGTVTQPVVFIPTNRVAPELRTGAWGGWIMRGGELVATAAIMTGSGAAASMSYSPGSSHRSEQPLLFAHNSVVRMTNCALINVAGQIGNGYHSSIVWDRCLIRRAITCGEYDGGTNIIKDSAIIEFPAIDGVYNATIADADYDGFYTINSTNYFENSLFGFAKDDAIDSGSGGPGSLVISNCWVESALHEAMAWSGEGRRASAYDSVLINCGQGFECGWSTTNATSLISPICLGVNLLSTANSVGSRYGDNYTGTSGLGNKYGFLTVSNSFILHNYRDVWGQVWDNTWNYRASQMDIRNNYLTAVNTNHPSNSIWNPAANAHRLAPFMATPHGASVGIGLALWDLQITPADLTNGIPVRLSSFTTNTVSVEYAIETPATTIATGTLNFTPGETVKKIFGNPAALGGAGTWRVALRNPIGGEVTGAPAGYAWATASQGTNSSTALITTNGIWKYLDDGSDQGTAWRALAFNDSAWSNGVVQIGFGDGDETTRIRRTNNTTAGNSMTTFYFRRAFNVTNLPAISDLSMWMLRDDGGVVYINGTEVFRSPSMPPLPAVITAATFANNQGSAPADNTIDTATLATNQLVAGTNLVAVEIHQFDPPSSDLSFSFTLAGNPTASSAPRLLMARFGSQLAINWSGAGYWLEQAGQVTGPWTPVTEIPPATVNISAAQQFFRLRKP